MSLTKDQERAVKADKDVCVTAGAGTGKTHMLSARYLHLLEHHKLSPLEIVATTFTERAAGEMRARIRRDVAAAGTAFPPEVAQELEAAPILTMHALAARICREHPHEAEVPADFSILDDRPEGPIWALEQMDAAIHALPASITAVVPADLLRAAMEAFLADPITAEAALACDPGDLAELLGTAKAAIAAELKASTDWQDAFQTLRQAAGVGLRETQRQDALAFADALERHQPGSPWPDSTPVLSINLQRGSQKGWDPLQYQEVKAALKIVRERVKAASLLHAEPGPEDEALARMIPALREAFARVRAQLTMQKARARVLDFNDLEVHALKALGNQNVREYYRSRWRAFLLDEVQDTNPVQAQMLDVLTAETILTIVGDEKQSIYGFRRADVTVFARMQEAIKARGKTVKLGESFRTHAPLLAGINQVCGPALGSQKQDLVGQREAPHDQPHLEVAVVPDELHPAPDYPLDSDARQRIEARYIARRLKAWHDEGLMVHDKSGDEHRPMRWGDVAILCRTKVPLMHYEEALAAEGIPTTLARGSDLLETPEARDAMALLRFLGDNRDDQALVALLRSPFFAVSDTVLHRVAMLRGDRDWWHTLLASSEPALARPLETLQTLRQAYDEPPSRILQLADRLTGYTAVLAGMPGARRRLADWQGVIAFVRDLEAGAQDVLTVVRRLLRLCRADREFERPALEAGDAVLLMTVHASKGLEWPVVVVPNLSAKKQADRAQVRFDATLGVALAFKDDDGETVAPLRFQILKRLKAEREEAEERRIAYVAMTRARDRLLMTAPNPDGGALNFLAPGFDEAGITPTEIQPLPGDHRPPLPHYPEQPPLPTRWFEHPLGTGISDLPVTALAEYACCPRAFAYRHIDGHPGDESEILPATASGEDTSHPTSAQAAHGPHAGRIGTATHLALELDLDDRETLQSHFEDLTPPQIDAALTLARNFRQKAVFQEAHAAIIARERPITLVLEGLELRGVVDAIGAEFVLDYKTDQVMDPEHHALQIWVYTQALGKTRAMLAYLRHDTLYEYPTAQLAAAGARAIAIAQAIRAGHFEATPSADACQGCAFASVCPHVASLEPGEACTLR